MWWKNLQVGDKLECIGEDNTFEKGFVYTINRFDGHGHILFKEVERWTYNDADDTYFYNHISNMFKLHDLKPCIGGE